MGDSSFVKSLNAADFADEQFGLITVNDILTELGKNQGETRDRSSRPHHSLTALKTLRT